MTASDRQAQLTQWLGQCAQLEHLDNIVLQPCSGDAGFRQYFRIQGSSEFLAVNAPPEQIDSTIFVKLVQYLREQGIHAPQVYAVDLARGFLLIEYFGDQLYLSALNADSVESLYGEALLTLLRLQQSPYDEKLFADYDSEKLREEMELFPHWFVGRLLGYVMTDIETAQLERVFKALIDSALAQPAVLVHRDYHSRNLIQRSVGPPGVIDFQDAVWGPVTYDLVSLLKDCYVRWPNSNVKRWAQAYGSMLTSAGLIKPVSTAQFQQWFDWMGLQRHFKVLGIFARLFLRDNKSAYLHDLPLVIRYVLETTADYSQFAPFNQWFRQRLLPLCEQQHWYQNYRNAGFSPAEAKP